MILDIVGSKIERKMIWKSINKSISWRKFPVEQGK